MYSSTEKSKNAGITFRPHAKRKHHATVNLEQTGTLSLKGIPPTQGTLRFTDQGQLILHPQNIAALQTIVDKDLSYYAHKYKHDPTYRQRMREVYAGQLQLMEDLKRGALDLPAIRKRANELATMNLRAHKILNDECQFTEEAKTLLLLAAEIYTKKSRQVNWLSSLPNITRVSISLALQMLKYGFPAAAPGIQITQWAVNVVYGATQLTFTILLPVDNGVGQPECVRAQTFFQPVTPNVSSSEPKLEGTVLPLRKPKVVEARKNAVIALVQRLESSQAIEETRTLADAEIGSTIDSLRAQLLRKVNKEGQRLNALHDRTTQESAALALIGDPAAAAKALLDMKDTTRTLSPKLRDKFTFLLEEIRFWTDLRSALSQPIADLSEDDAASGDDSSGELSATILPNSTTTNVEAALRSRKRAPAPANRVSSQLLQLRATQIHLHALMVGFDELNEQIEAGLGARRGRNVDNAWSALLSLVPNITSLSEAAPALANYYFGFFMDIALLFSLVRQPWRYNSNLPKDMARDLESKLIRQNELAFLLNFYAAQGADGGPNPKQLDSNMMRTAQVALKQLEECLKYDLQLKVQLVLSYFVDPRTLNPRQASAVTVANVVEEQGPGGKTFKRSADGVVVACTFSRLNAAVSGRKSREARNLFIEDLCNGIQASGAVRQSVYLLLDQYENVQTALQHLADKNLAGLFDDRLLTPQAQQMLAKSILYAQHRTDLEQPPTYEGRRFSEHEIDVILAGVKELCDAAGRSESRTLMACFQILQKQIINGYYLFLAGPGGFTFLKAVFTLMATFAEIYSAYSGNPSKTSTAIKLVGNLLSLIGSLTFGIVIGVVYGLFIALKNRLRNDFKSDPNNVNIAGVSYQTLGPGIHLSADYLLSKQTNQEMLVTPEVPPVEGPELDTTQDFATFFSQFLTLFRPLQPDTEQAGSGPDPHNAASENKPDSDDSSGSTVAASRRSDEVRISFDDDVRIPMADDIDQGSEQGNEQAHEETGHEPLSADQEAAGQQPAKLRAPVPPLRYANPIKMGLEFLNGTFTTINFRKSREYLNAQAAELAKLPEDELPGWIQGKFSEVMALVEKFEAGEASEEVTPSFEVDDSEASDNTSSPSEDKGLESAVRAVTRLRFFSHGAPFDASEREDRIQAVLLQVDEFSKDNLKLLRQGWREQAKTLSDHIDQLDPNAPLRPGYQQALEMMEEVLQQTRPAAMRSRKERRRATKRADKKTPTSPSSPTAANLDAQRAGFVSTDKLDKAERKSRVAREIQRIQSGPQANLPSLMAHWNAVHHRVVDLLNDAASRSDALEEFQWRQAAGMVMDLLSKLQAMHMQPQPQQRQAPMRSPSAAVQKQLRQLGLWQRVDPTVQQAILDVANYVNRLDPSIWHPHLTYLQTLRQTLTNIDEQDPVLQQQIAWTRIALQKVIDALEEKILSDRTFT